MNDNQDNTGSNVAEDRALVADVLSAYVSHNRVTADELPALALTIHGALQQIGQSTAAEAPAEEETYTPAVSVRASIKPDALISMIDGKPYKTLKRHLSRHGLTPAQYRTRYGLKADYPMTAASYSEARSAMAKQIGLGRKRAAAADEGAAEAKKPARKPRAKKTEQVAEAA